METGFSHIPVMLREVLEGLSPRAGGIYAESGMGCTGPVLLVPEDKVAESTGLLAKAGFLAAESSIC